MGWGLVMGSGWVDGWMDGWGMGMDAVGPSKSRGKEPVLFNNRATHRKMLRVPGVEHQPRK